MFLSSIYKIYVYGKVEMRTLTVIGVFYTFHSKDISKFYISHNIKKVKETKKYKQDIAKN